MSPICAQKTYFSLNPFDPSYLFLFIPDKFCGIKTNNCLSKKPPSFQNCSRVLSNGGDKNDLDVLWEPLHLSQDISGSSLNQLRPLVSDRTQSDQQSEARNGGTDFKSDQVTQNTHGCSILNTISTVGIQEKRRRRRRQIKTDTISGADGSPSVLEQEEEITKASVTPIGQDESTTQLRYVCRILQSESPSVNEIRMALPSVRALAHDQTLLTDESRGLTIAINDLVSRLQRACETCSSQESINLPSEERKTILEALQASKLLQPEGSAVQMTEVIQNGSLSIPLSHWGEQPALDKTQIQKEIATVVDFILEAASGTNIDKNAYNQMREHMNMLIHEADNPYSVLIAEMAAPLTVIRSLDRFINHMDKEFKNTENFEIDMKTHNVMSDLVARLTPLITSFDPQSIEFGLQTLYDAAVGPEAFRTHQIKMDHFTCTSVLRALELAVREHQLSRDERHSSISGPKNLWPVVTHLINRLCDDLASQVSDYQVDCSILDSKEGILVQHILLGTLSDHGVVRSPEEGETDSAFFQFCSKNSDADMNSHYSVRSPELLSPISELCTPDTSTYDTENTVPEATNVSPRNQSQPLHFSPTQLSESDYSEEQGGRPAESTEKVTPKTNCSVTDPKKSLVSMEALSGESETVGNGKDTSTGLSQQHSGEMTVPISRSTARQLASYLRSRLLDNLTSRQAQSLNHDINKSLDHLSTVVDQSLAKIKTEDHINLSVHNIKEIEVFLASDDTPYARILKRSLQPQIAVVPTREFLINRSDTAEHNAEKFAEKSTVEKPLDLSVLAMDTTKKVGHYLTVDEVKHLAKMILHCTKSDSQINLPDDITEMVCDWLQSPRPVLITEVVANRVQLAAQATSAKVCTPLNLRKALHELEKRSAPPDFPTEEDESLSGLTKSGELRKLSDKHNLTQLTRVVETIGSLVAIGLDWETCDTEDKQDIAQCVQLLGNMYPELNFPKYVSIENISEIWPLVSGTVENLPNLPDYARQWNDAKDVLMSHAGTEGTQLTDALEAAQLADTITASVIRLVSQPSCRSFTPTQAVAALELAQHLAQAAQSNTPAELQPFERKILKAITRTLFDGESSGPEGEQTSEMNWSIVQGLLSELTDSVSVNEPGEICLLPTTCLTLLRELPKCSPGNKNQQDVILVRSQLIRMLSEGRKTTQHSTIQRWKSALSRILSSISLDSSYASATKNLIEMVAELHAEPNSVTTQAVRESVVESINRSLPAANKDPKQLVRLARATQLLRSNIPLKNADIVSIIEEVNKPISTTVISSNQTHLAVAQIRAFLTVKRTPDESGMIEVNASDCAQLAESTLVLTNSKEAKEEGFDGQIIQSFKEQMLIGAVSGKGMCLPVTIMETMKPRVDQIRSKLISKQNEQTLTAYMFYGSQGQDTFKSYVQGHLQRYILDERISLQAWHSVRELASLIPGLPVSRDWKQAEHSVKMTLARVLIHTEDGEFFDIMQKSIAISFLNLMRMWLDSSEQFVDFWTPADGYTFAFVLGQLASRNSSTKGEPDREIISPVSHLLSRLSETGRLSTDPDLRLHLLQVVQAQYCRLKSELLLKMDPKLWTDLIHCGPQDDTQFAIQTTQKCASLVALITTIMNLHDDDAEDTSLESKHCVNLITSVLNTLEPAEWALTRGNLEKLCRLLGDNNEAEQKSNLSDATRINRLEVIEEVEVSLQILNTGMINDRTEALTLFTQLTGLQRFIHSAESASPKEVRVLKNILVCLLASSSDAFPFYLEPSLKNRVIDLVQQVGEVCREPVKHITQSALAILQKDLSARSESCHTKSNQFVSTSTPLSCSAKPEEDVTIATENIILTFLEKTQVANAITMVLASGYSIRPKQAKLLSQLLLRLQSDEITPIVLTHSEVTTATELLNSVLNDDSSTKTAVSLVQTNKMLEEDNSSSVLDDTLLSTDPVLLPENALQLNSSLTLALQYPLVQQELSPDERRSIEAVKRRSLFAALKRQTINVSHAQPILQRIGHLIRVEQPDRETDTVIRRLEKLTQSSMTLKETPFEESQHVDPDTSELLHQCLYEQLRVRPTTLATTLPVMSVITELEAANESATSVEYLNEDFRELYASFSLSPNELRTVTEFLRNGNSSTTHQVPNNSVFIRPSEKITALLLVRYAADGESIWPSESRLLLSALETLTVSNAVTGEFIASELAGLKVNLLSSADLEESVQNLYEGSGFTPSELEINKLKALSTLVASEVDEEVYRLISSLQIETKGHSLSHTSRVDREQVAELCRIFLLYLCSKPVPKLHELALMNRVACGLSMDPSDPDLLTLVRAMCSSSIRFSDPDAEMSCPIAISQVTRSVPAFIPDLLEQALSQGQTHLSFRPNGALLVSNILNFLALLDFQPGCDRLVPKWSSHLKRLALQILYSALLDHSIRLDVRSRALLSIAYKYYRSTLTDVSQDMVDVADEALRGKTALKELDASHRARVAECLCVALASPMRYNLSPVRAGFIASLTEALQLTGRQVTFDAADMQLVCETVHSLSDLENKVCICPSDTFTILSCLQNTEQFLDLYEQTGPEHAVLTRRDAAVMGAALEVLMNVAAADPPFESWDSDDPTTISHECRSSLGLTQCFLSSLAIGACLPSPAQQSATLTQTELSLIKQLINYWKPRLLLDSQRQRTSSIRKLSVSTECDLTADITNQQLANAVQLTVIHGRVAQPQDAWLCIQTLEQLVRSPANDYISISNSQRDALRLAMCPVRTSLLPSSSSSFSTAHQADPNLLTCMTYLHRILTASTTSAFGHRARFCVQPADVAAFATSLRILLDSFVGDLTHKEAFGVLRVMEQRMRCTAANLEAYWITQPESRAIREVLRYLYGQTGKAASDQLSRLVERMERSTMSIHNGARAIELDGHEQTQLLQSLRTHILLAPDSLPVDYGDLIELIDYLMYARPATLTGNHLTLLQELRTCELQQLAVQMQRNSSSELWFKALRSSMNHLTGQSPSNTPALASNYLYVHPREAASLFCILNSLNACAKCVDPSLILLQSALAYCVSNGQTWTLWSALPPNSQVRVRQALGNCVDDLVERLFETHASTWSTREWASLEMARDNMLRLLETNDSDLLLEGMNKLRLISLLIPGQQTSTEDAVFSRPPHISRYQPISGELSESEEPDSGSLLDALQCLEMTVLCDNVMINPEGCLEAMKAVHVLRSAPGTLQIGPQDLLLLQDLEVILFDLATQSVKKESTNTSIRFELKNIRGLPFIALENLLERIQTQWAINEVKPNENPSAGTKAENFINQDKSEQDTSKVLSLEMLQSTPLSSVSTIDAAVPVEGVQQAMDRFLSLCQSRVLQPEEITELTSSVDLLHRAIGPLTPRLRGYAQFSPGERNVLRNLQMATEKNHGYTLSPEAAEILQTLGHRLSTLALQANQELLQNGLELWLTASVDGRFVFDDRETQKLHSALCLARDTLRKDKVQTTSEEALGIVDRVIEQFSSTVDSGIGTEITGPYCLGPAVTEVLEGAKRAHEMLSLPGSSMSGASSSPSDWGNNYLNADGLYRQNVGNTGPKSVATDENVAAKKLDTDVVKPRGNLTDSAKARETEWSRTFTSDGNLSTTAENLSGFDILSSDRNLDDRCPYRRHTFDQLTGMSFLGENQKTHLYPQPLPDSVTEEQRRLKTREKLVEARLSQACRRVESLLAALPQSTNGSDSSKDILLDEKYKEVNRLRSEVLGLKEELVRIVSQLESTEKMQRRQIQFASSMRELMDNQNKLRMQLLSERAGLFSADTSQRYRTSGEQDSNCMVRLYRSSDCLKDHSPATISGVTTNVIHPHHSQVVLYKPIESEALDLSLTPRSRNRFSSLDRLHELIEIRRAVVAGSREELCRLNVYSSLPLRLGRGSPFQRPLLPRAAEVDGKQNTRSELTSGPRILHRLLERQRNYTKQLLGRASYEQDQNNRVLDALEERLTNLEQQIILSNPSCLKCQVRFRWVSAQAISQIGQWTQGHRSCRFRPYPEITCFQCVFGSSTSVHAPPSTQIFITQCIQTQTSQLRFLRLRSLIHSPHHT
ncbi:hypothetical protein FGIG_00347 [Fasciola gigantica]|uniref:Uncharacterized protein n=1 Tax=Fasciola gigantica TaxID=46835 RepID=A0A504YAE4_FASGI|nr:hypothetical protein FGIG_00347 [Fasciola gigantica]